MKVTLSTPKPAVTLELTYEEAQSLLGLMNHSSLAVGSELYKAADESRIGPLWRALKDAGIERDDE